MKDRRGIVIDPADEFQLELRRLDLLADTTLHRHAPHIEPGKTGLPGSRLSDSAAAVPAEAGMIRTLPVPMIWFCIIPALVMDIWATICQLVCFSTRGISQVNRRKYISSRRDKPRQGGIFRTWTDACFGYVNGAISYAREVAGRAEQHRIVGTDAADLKKNRSHYVGYARSGHRRVRKPSCI